MGGKKKRKSNRQQGGRGKNSKRRSVKTPINGRSLTTCERVGKGARQKSSDARAAVAAVAGGHAKEKAQRKRST